MSHPGRLRRHRGMRIAIVGGTGTLGGHVATELSSRGHEVRVLSRSAPEYRVDLLTGAGLETALEGCDVVVDASNNAGRKAAAVLVEGTRRLLAAEQAAGAEEVARWLLSFMRRPPTLVRMASVNGSPGLVVRDGSGVLTVVAFTVDRGRITALDAIRNPDKLTALPEAGPAKAVQQLLARHLAL
jgi:NAD(P)-dependent dehydrogenase (short-subunit alcohol dehydrogenase family)